MTDAALIPASCRFCKYRGHNTELIGSGECLTGYHAKAPPMGATITSRYNPCWS